MRQNQSWFGKLYGEFQDASVRLLSNGFYVFCWLWLTVMISEGRYYDALFEIIFIIFLTYSEVHLERLRKLLPIKRLQNSCLFLR